jgi:hypothetical protein
VRNIDTFPQKIFFNDPGKIINAQQPGKCAPSAKPGGRH